jgi:hypothetical protein
MDDDIEVRDETMEEDDPVDREPVKDSLFWTIRFFSETMEDRSLKEDPGEDSKVCDKADEWFTVW